ncbi:hypothetical protein EX895_002566 [Sporisorium graminicola]|uniref:non-specific serine/threonine protein kinase n=1 Tax=Sporisorium graminicola TaxID=280036 RepID=A0A4U7KWM4_9BASI|nr:hypothetical protein EX895_002566 [Sporisorium graminicola]TKY88577.1 hypothetical protein EX895_002566 [Sporisorium graminicola]
MSEQSAQSTEQAGAARASLSHTVFASPTPMDTSFPHSDSQSHHVPLASTSSKTAAGPPSAAPSAPLTPMSAPTPLSAPSASASTSAASSAAVSRVSSIRSNAPPPSSASNPRIRKGLLSRAGSEAEDRMARVASASHPQLTTDDDDDDPMISDSGPMPRRFASQNRGPSGAAISSRQSSNSSLPHTNRYPPNASTTSVASGHRSGSGDASEGAASSIGGVSLGRAMSVSSVSSVNSTSSLEAAPFREAPLGNVRLGFGAEASRFSGRNARKSPYGSLAMSTQPPADPSTSIPNANHSLSQSIPAADSRISTNGEHGNDVSLFSTPSVGQSTQATTLSASAPSSDRHRGVPKPASDAWMYRVGPGMRTNKPVRAPSSTASPELPELPLDDPQSAASPAKRSREILRQKFAKGAGRIGIRTTGLVPPPSEQYTVYNPLDSSEDETNLASASRTPLPRSSSYFSAAPHSASSAAGTTLHPLLTPVPSDFRTSSVTNAPLFVPKYAEDSHSSRLTPEAPAPPGPAHASRDSLRSAGVFDSQAPALPPLSYDAVVGSISSDLSPYLTAGKTAQASAASQSRRRSSATQKPPFLRARSSNDAFDRTASPGLLVNDPSAVDAPPASPALYTRSASALSAQRSPHVELTLDSNTQQHPTPAEVVRMEAQAGIASLPDSPSEPSPVPLSYSPAIEDESAPNRRFRDSSQSRLARPSSGTGSEASMGPATTGTSRRPDSLQRQRLWSNAKRPAVLRARTSESSIGKGRRSQSSDRKAYSPSGQSPVEGGWNEDRPGTHSKNSSSSTMPAGEMGALAPPHVDVIPEDDDGGGSGIVGTPDCTVMPTADVSAGAVSRPASSVEHDQGMAMSPPNRGALPFLVRPMPGPRSASPASQLARSPETIRVGPARITDSIYGRSPASISNLQSPRLLPSSASMTGPERPTTPSPRTSSARGPHDFHFGETLGEGSYSTVLEAWDLLSGPSPKEPGVIDPNATSAAAAMVGSEPSKRRRHRIDLTGRKAYAIKVLDKVHILKQGKQKYVSIEKEALSRMIRHPGVVTLFWTFQDRESLYFVLELANNGELLNFIRKHGSFDLESARFYAAQLADTIAGMHTAGVVHRDVKPENILLDARHRIKITDFGSAKIVHPVGETEAPIASEAPPAQQAQQSRAASFVGTAEYVSPELLVEKAQPAGKPADWWAFGCVLFQLLAGRPPFKGVNEYQTLQKVKNREFTFPAGFPEDAQDLIDRVLVLDPTQRPSASEIKAHRFFAAIDFDRLWELDAPQIKTGLVQPLPAPAQQREFADTSDFSFDEGFGSSDESQAYNGDTQSIDYQNHGDGGADESSLSLDAVSSAHQTNDADDSDSEASGGRREEVTDGREQLKKRQSGLQRLADGFQSRFMPSVGGTPPTGVQPNGGASGAPRRRFSSMSIDAAAPANAVAASDGIEPAVARGMRPFSRSMQTMNAHSAGSASHSPSSTSRLQPQPASVSTAAIASGGNGLQQSWAALLLPKELMLYSLPVAQKKTGTGKMFTKRRQLVLTDFPRLLCVKDTATALKVKSEVILAIPKNEAMVGDACKQPSPISPAGGGERGEGEFEKLSGRQVTANSDDDAGANGDEVTAANVRFTSQQAIPNLLTGIEYRGGRSFTIRIANGRTFQYETAGDASALVRCIQEARRAA